MEKLKEIAFEICQLQVDLKTLGKKALKEKYQLDLAGIKKGLKLRTRRFEAGLRLKPDDLEYIQKDN